MHLTLSIDVRDELVAILTHASIDYITSSPSTVPYNQDQCEAYIRLIQATPDSNRTEGYKNYVLAHLWSEIEGNYFFNLRGEDDPCLSRRQRLDSAPGSSAVKGSVMLKIGEWFGHILEVIGFDQLSHWRKLMREVMSEWKLYILWTSLLLIIVGITFGLSLHPRGAGSRSLLGSMLAKIHRDQTEVKASARSIFSSSATSMQHPSDSHTARRRRPAGSSDVGSL